MSRLELHFNSKILKISADLCIAAVSDQRWSKCFSVKMSQFWDDHDHIMKII